MIRSIRGSIISRLLWLLVKVTAVAAIAGFFIYRAMFSPVPVDAFPVGKQDIKAETLGTGTLEARVQASISPRISGRIAEIKVDQGDRVIQGKHLISLDDGDLRQQVEVAKAQTAAVQAGIERAATDIVRAEAVAADAKTQFDRLAETRVGAVSQQDRDNSVRQLKVANAELARARAAKVELERQLTAAEQTQRYQQEKLADARISAPFAGLVLRRSREPGDVVVPGGEVLLIASLDQLWISAWVDESSVNKVAAKQPARVVFRSDPARSYAGTVTRMSPQTDRETREFLVDVTLSELPKSWALGQRAEVMIETANKSGVLAIPLRTISWKDRKAGVYVNDGGTARWREMTLGLRGSDRVEVTGGLKIGDTVIVPKGDASLRDGRAVSVP